MDLSLLPSPLLSSDEVKHLRQLVAQLKQESSLLGKLLFLTKEERVKALFPQVGMEPSSREEEFIIKSIIAIKQEKIFYGSKENIRELLEVLQTVETFYEEIGGIVGYHFTLLELFCQSKQRFSLQTSSYHAPVGLDISTLSPAVQEAVYSAIEGMPELSEMYPIGGAADRLNLKEEDSGVSLPAALLPFKGRTMLEGLVEDLQAREYLYYKIKGKQITLPVAMMTSKEKNNHHHILALFEKNQWFFRPKEKFSFFCQPLVPVVNKQGDWVLLGPGQLLLKPGGHGVMWKLARDNGVIEWFKQQGAKKTVVRQINNPVSSEDYGLLAFSGYGLKHNKKFGFASCRRQLGASEGVNVIVGEEKEHGFSYTLTNIEYCDFQMYGLEDAPASANETHSKFPSNTNLLFADLFSIEEALKHTPVPGVLVNLKRVHFYNAALEKKEEEIARLESTMQNMADCFVRHASKPLGSEELLHLDSYITFGERRKTISAAKREYFAGGSLLETPEGCFLEGMENSRELLEECCRFILPRAHSEKESLYKPPFLFYFHPALGPIYSVIGAKIRGGRLSRGGEIQLYISECDMENVSVEGSLLIRAEQIMGHVDDEGILQYSDQVGRCTLKNVRIKNKGIDYEQKNVFWKKVIQRKEALCIVLKGNSEFYAEDILIEGALSIEVESGWKMTLQQKEGRMVLLRERLTKPSWRWEYGFAKDKTLVLQKKLGV